MMVKAHLEQRPWTRRGALVLAACVLLCAAVARGADVDIALVRMGVGNHVRPGDPTAILVRATSGLQAPVQARIEWAVINADGDTARYARDVALAPGAPVERWLYGVTPIISSSAQTAVDKVTIVRVLEMKDGRVQRVLGEKRIDGSTGEEPAVPVETTESLIGVIGDGRAGLATFATPTPNLGFIASMNEMTKIARGISAGDLPDRWEGLASYESIIWTNAPLQSVGIDQARALLDWTRRGGNFVIVLPEAGDPWGLAGKRNRTPFAEALPEHAERRDAVPVAELLPVLTRSGELRNPTARTSIWTFPNDPGNGFSPLLLAPAVVDQRTGNLVTDDSIAGRALVVRRPFGFGFVTVIGVDVDGLDRRALSADGIPQADQFWNRILGRRADTPGPTEWSALVTAKRLETRGGLVVPADGGALVNQFIGLRSQAAIGILGLLGAFAIYWMIAGPISHWVLRGAKRPQYAWLAFVTVAAVATAIAWAVTGSFELKSGRVQHMSFVDRIERPGATSEERALMRVQSWFSAELPGYGTAKIALQHGDGAAGSDLLTSWFPPPAGNLSGFPDSETYEIPATSPAAYTLPSRATSTVLSATWMGVALPAWHGTPREVSQRQLRQDITWGANPRIVLSGALLHSLPAPLHDVMLIHVTPFHGPTRAMTGKNPPLITPSDDMPSYARVARLAQWDPEVPLDVGLSLYGIANESGNAKRSIAPALARDTGVTSAATTFRALWYEPVLASNLATIDPAAALNKQQRLDMLQLYAMLQPPSYLIDPDRPPAGWRGEGVRVERDFARGVDMSRWCAAPCLIVIGKIEDSGGSGTRIDLPFPFTIDGDEPRADGVTYVRVVFPLPAVPGAMIAPAAATRASASK